MRTLPLTPPLPTTSVCVAAIVRIFFINTIHWADATYTFVNLGIWLNVECNVGIISACLPILPPLLKHMTPLLKKLSHSVFSSKGSSNSHGRLMSAGSERADAGSGSGSKQERRDERIKTVNEGSAMSSFEQRTPKDSSFTGVGQDKEAQNVHLPD